MIPAPRVVKNFIVLSFVLLVTYSFVFAQNEQSEDNSLQKTKETIVLPEFNEHADWFFSDIENVNYTCTIYVPSEFEIEEKGVGKIWFDKKMKVFWLRAMPKPKTDCTKIQFEYHCKKNADGKMLYFSNQNINIPDSSQNFDLGFGVRRIFNQDEEINLTVRQNKEFLFRFKKQTAYVVLHSDELFYIFKAAKIGDKGNKILVLWGIGSLEYEDIKYFQNPMFPVLIIAGLVLLAIIVFIIPWFKKFSCRYRFLCSGLLCVIADFVFFLFYYKFYVNKAHILLISIENAIKMINFSICETQISGLKNIDSCLYFEFMVLTFLTPIFWASFVINLFPKVENFFRFKFYKIFKEIYFFSELNKNSLQLALSLTKDKGAKEICVFCNIETNCAERYLSEAEANRFIMLSKPMSMLIKKMRYGKKWTYFAISENQDESLSVTKDLLNKYAGHKKNGKSLSYNIHILLYSEQVETNLVSTAINELHLPFTVINRNRFFADDLFFRHPITQKLQYCKNVGGKKQLSVLVLGAGKLGIEIIKNIIWSSELGKDYSLMLNIFDKNAKKIREQFFTERPDLKSRCDKRIIFNALELYSKAFLQKLRKLASNVNYICICLGNDELNIQTALFLRRYLMRNGRSSRLPFIAVETRNDIKSAATSRFIETDKNMSPDDDCSEKMIENKDLKYHFHSFAKDDTLYSKEIINSPLSELAFNVHFEYEKVRSQLLGEEVPCIDTVRKTYYMSELTIRVARARAIHISSKLHLLRIPVDFSEDFEKVKKVIAGCKDDIKQMLLNRDIVAKLADVEHARWVAYMRCEKWVHKEFSQTELQEGIYKRVRERQHYCMQKLSKIDNSYLNFRKYDEQIVKNILKILGIE